MCVRLVRMFFWVWPRTLKSKVSRRPRKNCVMTGSRVRCRRMISLVRLISSNLHRGQLWEFYKIIYSSCAKLNYLSESVTMQCRKELRAIYGSLLVPTGPLSTTQYHITPRLQLPLWTMNDDVPDPFLGCRSFVPTVSKKHRTSKLQNFVFREIWPPKLPTLLLTILLRSDAYTSGVLPICARCFCCQPPSAVSSWSSAWWILIQEIFRKMIHGRRFRCPRLATSQVNEWRCTSIKRPQMSFSFKIGRVYW